MRARGVLAVISAVAVAVALAACTASGDGMDAGDGGSPSPTATKTVPFLRAELRVEVNATDGDAGLQVDLDHDPWSEVRLIGPDGQLLMDVQNSGVLEDYGLTELFSESSEPPFTEVPLDEFKQLFPEGEYVFEGTQTDGVAMRSTFDLTHDFPAGPKVTSPEEGATVVGDRLVVRWKSGDNPEGVKVVGYQVLVVSETESERTLAMDLPKDAFRVGVPWEFLAATPGGYKVEVLAIEKSGNQTLTEVPFLVE